ncbi:MAG: TolC family protein [Kiritimatiellia bacterium]
MAIVEHNRALAQTRASAETRRLREQTAQAERDRFDVGTSTSLLVAQAQRDVLESQINELESRIDYRIALVRLQEITGELLERYGVEVNRD